MRIVALLFLGGCASTIPRMPGPTSMVGRVPDSWERLAPPEKPVPEPPRKKSPKVARLHPADRLATFRTEVLAASRYYLENAPSRDDCSGYVCAVFAKAGFPMSGSVKSIWDRAQEASAIHHRKVPNVGDIAFFDNTFDANGNRKVDDELSHIALVIQVDDDGTILMAHGGSSQGRTTLVMNLEEPEVRRREDGREVNDYLRRASRRDKKGTKYLASQLWRGFATVKPAEIEAWLGS